MSTSAQYRKSREKHSRRDLRAATRYQGLREIANVYRGGSGSGW